MPGSFGSHADRLYNARIRSASADVSLQRRLDFGLARIGVSLQKRNRTHDQTGGAVTALHGVGIDKSRLDRVQATVGLKAFNRRDSFTLRGFERSNAGSHRNIVQQHRACAALAFAATVLGAGQIEFIAEDIEERPIRAALQRSPDAVDHEIHISILRLAEVENAGLAY